MYEESHQLCWIAVFSSSDKEHRAHGLQLEVEAPQQKVTSWSSGQGCIFIKVIKVIIGQHPLPLARIE